MKTNELVDYIEDKFVCEVGDQAALHDFPEQKVALPYVVYALKAKNHVLSREEELTFALQATIDKLSDLGGTKLFWRNKEKVSFEPANEQWPYDTIRARILVIDDDFNTVRLEKAIKPEGAVTPEIAA